MSKALLFWLFMLLGVALEVIGDIFFKKYAISNRPLWLGTGMAIYIIGTLFWAFSLKYEMLSKAILVFAVLNLVIISLVGILFFKENLSTLAKVGLILGIVSVVLIERG